MRNISFGSINNNNNNNDYINVMNNNGIDGSVNNGHNEHNGHNGHNTHVAHSDAIISTKSLPKPSNRRQSIANRQTKRPSSERRFKCDQCERMFFTRKDVKRHLVVHTGIRNFACPYCTQRFGRKDHLVRHAKKSHNRDTRSSASLKDSQHINSKAMPTLIQPKSTAISPQINASPKSSLSYSNNQTADHSSTLLLLTNNECASYGAYGCSNGTNSGINGMNGVNESMYVSGMHHSFDQMKSETHSIGAAHHYFAFPVNSANYTHTTFIPQCFVTSNTNGINSCGSTSMAAFGSIHTPIPVPVCNDHSGAANAIHATISLDVNPSLPHFNQAFQ